MKQSRYNMLMLYLALELKDHVFRVKLQKNNHDEIVLFYFLVTWWVVLEYHYYIFFNLCFREFLRHAGASVGGSVVMVVVGLTLYQFAESHFADLQFAESILRHFDSFGLKYLWKSDLFLFIK